MMDHLYRVMSKVAVSVGFVALSLTAAIHDEANAQCGCEGAESNPDPESSLTYVERYSVDRYCYYCSSRSSDERYGRLVFRTLVRPEPDTRQPRDELAHEYEVDEAAGTITFTLCDNSRWAWGDPVTAQDVVTTFDFLADSRSCVRQTYQRFATEVLRSVDAVSEQKVVFTFRRIKDTAVEHFFHYPILPGRMLLGDGLTPSSELCARIESQSNSLGPYRFSQSRGPDIMLTPNPEFRGGGACMANIGKLWMRVIGDRTLWDDALETNQAQLLIDVPRSMATQFSGSLDFDTVTYGYLSCIYIALNLKNPVFADPNVRRAMLHGFNRERHLASTYQGFGEVLAAPLGSESRFADRTLQPLEYSDSVASRLLDDAGFLNRGDDGIRLYNSKSLSFELLVAQESFNEHQSALKFFQDAMDIIGIDIRLKLVDPNELRQRVAAGSFDMYWGQWQFIDGISVLRVFESGSDDNTFGYASEMYDQIIANAERAETIHQYSTFIRLAQEHLADQVPALFLWDLQQIALHTRRLKNLKVSAYNIFDYVHEAYMTSE